MKKMKNKFKIMKAIAVFVLMTLTALPIGALAQEEETPTASADVGVFSKYIWRGLEFSDDSVVIQPSATVGYKGFALNMWGNLDTNYDDGEDKKSQFNETDLTISYDKSFGMVSIGVGYIYYGLDAVDDSQELYASIGPGYPFGPNADNLPGNRVCSRNLHKFRDIAFL